MRYFNDPDGVEENIEPVVGPDGVLLHRIPGQHQLLGWTLTEDHLRFLAAIGAALIVDEYG